MRERRMPLTLRVGLLGLLGAVLGPFPLKAAPQESKPALRIGVIQSLTGIAAEYGKGLLQALQLSADELNAEADPKVELIVEDDGTDPKKAVAAFQSLASRGVDAVIGASWDFPTNAIIPLAARSKLVLFNVSVMPEALDLGTGEGYVFANAETIDQEAAPLKDFLKLHPVRSASIAYANNRWGEQMLAAHRRVLIDAGVAVLDEVKPTGFDANQWGGVLPRIRAKKPELMLLLLNKNDIDVFLHRAEETRFSTLYYTTNNSFDAVKDTNNKGLFEGVCFAYPFARLQKIAALAGRYKERFHEPPRWFADNSYDAVRLLHAAWVTASSKGIPLREALWQTDYSGLAGRYRFQGNASFSLGGLSLVCLRDGQVTLAPSASSF